MGINKFVDILPGVTFRCLLDENWTMLYVSGHSYELTGYEAKEFLKGNIHFEYLIYENDKEFARKIVAENFKTKSNYQLEYRLQTKQGKVKWVWESATFSKDENGRPIIEGFIQEMGWSKVNKILKTVSETN